MMTYTNSIRNTTKLSQSIYTSRVETWYTVSSLLLLLLAVAAAAAAAAAIATTVACYF